jgi:hypothetical protein
MRLIAPGALTGKVGVAAVECTKYTKATTVELWGSYHAPRRTLWRARMKDELGTSSAKGRSTGAAALAGTGARPSANRAEDTAGLRLLQGRCAGDR